MAPNDWDWSEDVLTTNAYILFMARSRKKSNTGKSKKRNKHVSIDPSSPKTKLEIDSAPDLLEFGDASTPMADRYYELAETMNARGAMELAVPFYRQAIALLLFERDRLRQQLSIGQFDSDDNAFQIDKLQGLLDIEQVREEREVCEISSQGNFENKNISASMKIENTDAMGFFVSSRLDSRIIELAEELTIESAQQVLVGLLELEQVVGELPSGGHNLRGKALMLQGEQDSAMSSFESAMALAPHHAGIRINTGAARLANGDLTGALSLLREVHGEGLELLNQATGNALLRNLSHAESQAGNPLKAICIRRE